MDDSDRLKDLSFRKTDRLLNSGDFTAVFDNAQFKAPHSNFLILAKANNLGYPRLGLIIAKKNIRLAVNRNRVKRLIRETFRLKQHNLPAIDAIVLARRGGDQIANQELLEILENLWKRLAKRVKKTGNTAVN
ncbi:ribonuclease P protein component [Teredinibacter haidensis]|uniref:ribonuclease P protein component n=1 Tax=Teredinibacter haidensis TaxID=2731755 RepID=UPI000A9078DC|nr:ribonuclease P protein component [Teredinibacter haidensis]